MLTRRVFSASSVAFLATTSKPAFSQADEVRTIAQTAVDSALEVLQFAQDIDQEEVNFRLGEFVALEYISRQENFDLLRGAQIVQVTDKYSDELSELLPAFRGDQTRNDNVAAIRAAVSLIEDEGLPTIPSRDSVEPIGIPSVLPSNDGAFDDIRVTIDIILEGLGIGEPGLLTNAIQSNPELEANFEELVSKISTKDWRAVTALLEGILNAVAAEDYFVGLTRRARRKFLFRLALRAVPVAGWLYTIASLIIAFKSNYHRFSFA